MKAANDSYDTQDAARKVHVSRLKKLNNVQHRSIKNAGKRVDAEIKELTSLYNQIQAESIQSFEDLPLSSKTQQGLAKAKYVSPTEIQREAIALGLQGHDILGAAKTGSGKTLAFLIPVLECLFRNKIGFIDGMTALIISPTRELAYQTYEVLKKIGSFHDFSAGLIIGGTNLKEEADRISKTHIVICTPGRLKQHMEETWGFNADGLLMLVLDECDKILDLGFEETLNAILEYVPRERQTLMFSATQTKSVKDLARVGLKSPMYVSVHEKSEFSTPQALEQSYLVCDLHQKVNLLWFFIKNHLKSKILVFLQTAKQVRYISEAFRRIRPGVTLLALYGTMKQIKRVKMYEEFCRKQYVVLLATDIAARGLDFPGVNWVVQFDAPENADTYIHRVGRTARLDKDGEALLFLLPSEKDGTLHSLAAKKIPINEIQVNPRKMGDITKKLASQLVEDPELKEFAKACFISYIRSIFLLSNKSIFDVKKLDTEGFAKSLGLVLVPRIRFLQRHEKLQQCSLKVKNITPGDENVSGSSSEDSSEDSEHESVEDKDESTEEQLITVKQTERCVVEETEAQKKLRLEQELEAKAALKQRPVSKRDLAKAMLKKGLGSKRTVFSEGEDESSSNEEFPEGSSVLDIEAARRRIADTDNQDKETYRQRIKRKHQELRRKTKDARRAKRVRGQESEDSDEPVAVLDTAEPSRNEEAQGDESDIESADGSECTDDGKDSIDEGSDSNEALYAAASKGKPATKTAQQANRRSSIGYAQPDYGSYEASSTSSDVSEASEDEEESLSEGEAESELSDSNGSSLANTNRDVNSLAEDEAFVLSLLNRRNK